jgi:hypothetical protein
VTLVGVSGLEGVSQVLIVCEIVLVFGNVSPMASTPVKHPRAIFKRWYPDIDLEVEEMPVAA